MVKKRLEDIQNKGISDNMSADVKMLLKVERRISSTWYNLNKDQGRRTF